MNTKEITLYPEMNAKIKDILRLGNDSVCLYAAARIEQLEMEDKELQKGMKRLSQLKSLLPMTFKDARRDNNRPIWIHLIKGWNSLKGDEYYGKEWLVYADVADYPAFAGMDNKQHSGLWED